MVSLVLLFGVFSTASAAKSIGLATGNLTTADAAEYGVGYVGGFVGFGDEAAAVFGSITYGISEYTEGRVKFGFSDRDAPDTDPQFLFGLDVKYELMDYYDKLRKNPFDLATGGFIEYVNYEGFSTVELGGNLIGSLPFRFESGQRLIPYSRINLRWERYSSGGESDSYFRGGLNIGTKFELNSDFGFYGEIQIDGNTGVFGGLEMRAF